MYVVLKFVSTGHAAALAYHGTYGGKVLTGKVRRFLKVSIAVDDWKYVSAVHRHYSKRRKRSRVKLQNLDSTMTSPERHGVSYHRQFDCFNSLFSKHHRNNQSSLLRALSEGNPPIRPQNGQQCGNRFHPLMSSLLWIRSLASDYYNTFSLSV